MASLTGKSGNQKKSLMYLISKGKGNHKIKISVDFVQVGIFVTVNINQHFKFIRAACCWALVGYRLSMAILRTWSVSNVRVTIRE